MPREREEQKRDPAPRRGATFSDVLIEMGDDLERWFKGLVPWAVFIGGLVYAEVRQWTVQYGRTIKKFGVLAWEYCRARDTALSRWFRNRGTPAVRRFRQGQQDALAREQEERTHYWGCGWFFRNLRDLFGINPGL